MRKLFYICALVAAFGLAACTTQPTQSGDPGATAPSSSGQPAPAPASSCGGSGKG